LFRFFAAITFSERYTARNVMRLAVAAYRFG